MDERLRKQLDFILEVDKSKFVVRQTYLTDGIRKEDDAEHSWHIALMAILLAEYSNEPVDVLRLVSMLLVHDLIEIVVLMVCSDETFLDQMAEDICSNIRSCSENDRDMRIIGPSAPVIAKIRDIYRRVVYIKNYRYNELVALKDQIEIYVSEKKELQDFSLQFDFNPLNMY